MSVTQRLFVSVILAMAGLFMTTAIMAQPALKVGQIESCDQTQELLPVLAENAISGLNVVELHIEVDPALVQFAPEFITNVHPSLQSHVVNYAPQLNKLIFIWLSLTPASLQPGEKLFDMDVFYAGGHADFAFLELSYLAINFEVSPAVFTGGMITPVIDYLVQPESQEHPAGGTAEFVVEIAGDEPFAYQWQQNLGNGWEDLEDGTHISGSTTSVLVLEDLPVSFQGREFRCQVILDDCISYSQVARLDISGQPEWYLLFLEASPEEGGSVSALDGYYASGTLIEGLEATAAEGYHFVSWTDQDDTLLSDVAVFDLIMPEALTILTAHFEINIYTLTYTAGENGTLEGETTQTLTHGSDGSAVLAVANEGYHFVQWSDGLAANPRTDTHVTASLSVEAQFAINTYTLLYSTDGNGQIEGEQEQSVQHGSDGSPVLAVANEGYHFLQWSDGLTDNPRTDTGITADLEVMAEFGINVYTLTYSAAENGSLEGELVQNIEHGSDGSQVLAVADEGYHFVQWSDGLTDNPRTDLAVTASLEVEATFSINMYSLSLDVLPQGSGQAVLVEPQDETGPFAHGTQLIVEAIAGEGFAFEGWTMNGANLPGTEMFSFEITANTELTARFYQLGLYTITLTAQPEGAGILEGAGEYWEDEQVQVSASPEFGYAFLHWTENGEIITQEASFNFIASASRSLTAVFEPLDFVLSAEVSPVGSGTVSGTGSFPYNSQQILTAMPAEGYHFVEWTEEAEPAGDEPQLEVLVSGDRHFTAGFALNIYTLSYLTDGNGEILGENPQQVEHGGDGTAVEAIPFQGYYFAGWSDGLTINPRTDTGITGDLEVSALFAPLYEMEIYLHMHAAAAFVPGESEVFITGSMFDWAEPGTQPSDQLFQTTEDEMVLYHSLLLKGGEYAYKFFIGNGWDGGEWTSSTNRELLLASDTTLIHVFGDITDESLSVPGQPQGFEVLLYPNPLRSQLHIRAETMMENVRLFDMQGRLVHQAQPFSEYVQLSLDALPAGLYIVQIESRETVQSHRIQIYR